MQVCELNQLELEMMWYIDRIWTARKNELHHEAPPLLKQLLFATHEIPGGMAYPPKVLHRLIEEKQLLCMFLKEILR